MNRKMYTPEQYICLLLRTYHVSPDARRQIDRLMPLLDELEAKIIHLRWRDGLDWAAVSRKVFYSADCARRHEKRGIEKMAKMLRTKEIEP